MSASLTLRYATRRSPLALAQSQEFADALASAHGCLQLEPVTVVTSGDRIVDRPLSQIGGKGLFVKEIEATLYNKDADFAVHSMKDVPAVMTPGLCIACIPQRVDARDVLVSQHRVKLADLPANACIGTCSGRRHVMLLRARPDLRIVPLRGNVETRLRKVHDGHIDATVLAWAGLHRLARIDQAAEVLCPELFVPAPGQGALAIQCRSDSFTIRQWLAKLHHRPTAIAVATERGVLAQTEGNCQIPVAAYARRTASGALQLDAMLATADMSRVCFDTVHADWPESEGQATDIGKRLGDRLRRALQRQT